MKVSNKFTFARLIFAPVFYFMYNLPLWTGSWAGTKYLSFASACLMIPLLIVFQMTDYWDGHYARKYNEVSDFGKLFDPFADVMLNLSIFVCAMKSIDPAMAGYMPSVIFILIMYREFSQSFLRMLATKQGIAIAARKGGKVKTVFYIISAFFMLTAESFIRLGLGDLIGGHWNFDFTIVYPYARLVVQILFVVDLILSWTSFADYIKNFASVFKDL